MEPPRRAGRASGAAPRGCARGGRGNRRRDRIGTGGTAPASSRPPSYGPRSSGGRSSGGRSSGGRSSGGPGSHDRSPGRPRRRGGGAGGSGPGNTGPEAGQRSAGGRAATRGRGRTGARAEGSAAPRMVEAPHQLIPDAATHRLHDGRPLAGSPVSFSGYQTPARQRRSRSQARAMSSCEPAKEKRTWRAPRAGSKSVPGVAATPASASMR
jgi:hypothetical protein